MTVFLTVTDFFTGAVFLTAFGFFAGVGFFAGAVFLVTCKQKQRHHQHHREIKRQQNIFNNKKTHVSLDRSGRSRSGFLHDSVDGDSHCCCGVACVKCEDFLLGDKAREEKRETGRETQNKRSIQNDTLFYLFFRRLLGVKKIRKNCIERFSSSSSSSSSHFFFPSRAKKKMHRQKSKKMPKEKRRGLSKKKKRKRERRGPQLFDHHRPPPSSFLKKKRRDKNRTAEKKKL